MSQSHASGLECSIGPDLFSDLLESDLLQLAPGERLWKLYCFHSAAGQSTALQHRIYTKLKHDGHLAMVTFAVHTPSEGRPVRSGIARVPDLNKGALEQIIETIRRDTQARPMGYEEVDLSRFATLEEQIRHLEKASTP